MLAEVRRVLDATVPADALVLLAVSGGPDSTALAYLVVAARPDLDASVAHVRHGLRDDSADAEVAATHAAALGLGYHERSVTVASGGQGIEAAARDARYAALRRTARAVGARALLVGHTADDQAETILLNVARGTGLRGLAGMPVTRPEGSATETTQGVRLVRPLLRLRRADVRAFVSGEGLRTVSDPTNCDPRQRRSRARQDLLPALAALSGGTGDPVAALTRLADLARADADALDALAARAARQSVVAWGPARAVRAADLTELPRALAGRVIRLLLRAVRPDAEISAAAVSAVLALDPGDALHGPGGVWVTCGAGWLAAVPPSCTPLPERTLTIPGTVPLPLLGLAVHGDRVVRGTPPRLAAGGPDGPTPALAASPPGAGHAAWAVVGDAGLELVVRGRRPGDRMDGDRLTDVLSDSGIPRALRDLLPVVATTGDRVLWVPGLRPATSPTPAPGRGGGVRLWLAPVERSRTRAL